MGIKVADRGTDFFTTNVSYKILDFSVGLYKTGEHFR